MGAYNQDKRLETLEAETPERPTIAVLEAKDGEEAEAFARYRAETPEEKRAELVVVVRQFV